MTTHPTTASPVTPELVKDKLEAFDQLQTEFEESFLYVQDMHGQRRFPSIPVAGSVHYLHALWVCECKDRLLSIPKTISRYEGRHCLELLQRWQKGDTTDVVAFLQRKLDMLPFADLTCQLHEARQKGGEAGLAKRLEHGRLVLLNRGMNLMQALDSIFSLSEEDLVREVQVACMEYGHRPSQIEKQMAELNSPLYSYMPHQILAQRNIAVMNKMGVNVIAGPSDIPGQRSWRVLEPTVPPGPFAEHVIEGYQELVSPSHNNINAHRFVDRPERSDVEEV